MTIARFGIEGEPFALGHALGAAMAPAIRRVVLELDSVRGLLSLWSGSDQVAGLEAAARAAFPRYLREIEGIAAGAGLPFEAIFIWNCRGDLPGAGAEDDPGCTSLLAVADDGQRLIAHNEDGAGALDGHCALIDARPAQGLAFTSFAYPGMLPGHSFGFNAAGLVQTINHLAPQERPVGVPRHIVCRAILDAADLDQALAILRRGDRAGGFHHNLGRVGEARLLSVEAPGGACAIREVTRHSAHANHLVFEALSGRPQSVSPSSRDRQRRAEALIGEAAPNAAGLLSVLSDAGGEGLPICRKAQRPEDDGFTLATAVFEVGPRRLAWQVHAHPAEPPLHRGDLVL